MNANENIYGLMAEFSGGEEILLAAQSRATNTAYRKMDAFTPFPSRRPCRKSRPKKIPRAAHRFDRGNLRRTRRLFHGMVCERRELSDQHRRTPAQ